MESSVLDTLAVTGEVATHYRPEVLEALQLAAREQSMTPEGRAYIERALNKPIRNKLRNTKKGKEEAKPGRYQSARMGCSLDNTRADLGAVVLSSLEQDENVVAIITNAPSLKIRVRTPTEQSVFLEAPFAIAVGHQYTAIVSVVEEREIRRAVDSGSDRYALENGSWVYPSARDAAERLGFKHKLLCGADFPRTLTRNYAILGPYFERDLTADQRHTCDSIAALVRDSSPLSIFDVLHSKPPSPVGIDDVLRCLAEGSIATDLSLYDLAYHQRTLLFPDSAHATAFANANLAIGRASSWDAQDRVKLGNGAAILWDGVLAKIEHKGVTAVEVRREDDIVTLPRAKFDQLEQSGLIVADPNQGQETDRQRARRLDAHDHIRRASAKDLAIANARMRNILPYLTGVKKSPSCRSVRRHLKDFRDGEREMGNGFARLIPGTPSRDRERKLLDDVLNVVFTIINEEYLSPKNLSARATHELIVCKCEDLHLEPPSYSWLCRELKKLDPYKVALARKGSKAAYQVSPRGPVKKDGDFNAEPFRAFQRAHIDSTQIDLETIYEDTNEPLGRPWLTVMLDHVTRRVISFHLSYDAPSYRCVLAVIRDCVRRHGGLPEQIYVDNGPEFRNVYLEGLCHSYGVHLEWRPSTKPRFGAQIERFFGSANTMLFYRMLGNTQLTRNVFAMTEEVDPVNHAVWTLPRLAPTCDRFFFEIYDTTAHVDLLMSPRACFKDAVRRYGTAPSKAVDYDETFLISTCPTTGKGTAKVTLNGVKINYFWFNSDLLYPFVGGRVEVRFDPDDLSKAWAYVNRAWRPLTSKKHALLLGLTERDYQLACEMFRAARGDLEYRRLNDRKLARFMEEIREAENFLTQRKREAMARTALLAVSASGKKLEPAVGPVPSDNDAPTFVEASGTEPGPLGDHAPRLLPTL